MPETYQDKDTVRASRAGHTYHERWAARRALQLVFPNDGLFAVAVEGISSTETGSPGTRAEEVADLVFYYGDGDNFVNCQRLETVQFKYKLNEDDEVTGSYLKKTIEKFCDTIIGYQTDYSAEEIDKKLSFLFVTNAIFSENLWDAIESINGGTKTLSSGAATQARNLKKWCAGRGLAEAIRLFSRIDFKAGQRNLAGQNAVLKRIITDWSTGTDADAKARLYGIQNLLVEKAGPSGQSNNLIHREDILDALDCYPEDLFPAETRFVEVGNIIERTELKTVSDFIGGSSTPLFIHAEGGVGKTVFVQSLAARMDSAYEVVVFDCFGGGSYRSDEHSRHLPKIGLVQIVNELASRTLCDPMLPAGDDTRKVMKAARRRLAQAAAAVRIQSSKLGLLVIIDAADNAQLEADSRHEEAFPKRLLAMLGDDPIDGVQLLLTARSERRATVIGRSTVQEVELGPFTDAEARRFLNDRKPEASAVEVITALARSGRNARVLDYLVEAWDTNVLGKSSADPITVPDIIAQRCKKIVGDLYIAGWPESEVNEFFVALSLLPPPIPLDELAGALGWPAEQVHSAASDLAPMLEVIPSHGAIFRDEPTETYIRNTYSDQPQAQRAIADRLLAAQGTSTYAAEALPHFLVIINDSDRAFELADSTTFPATVQSDFGRRRLILARLRAAFRLAVAASDFDRVLGLSMRLAQAATANMRGDEFIRRLPPLAVVLGDADSFRRLYSDRSGWRGARSARLTVAYQFAGDTEEAQIQSENTIRWINWHSQQPTDDENDRKRSGPVVDDFAAVMLQSVIQGEFVSVDRNLSRWNDRFSRSASEALLQLLKLYDDRAGATILNDFIIFASSEQSTSRALKLKLLALPEYLSKSQARALAKSIATSPTVDDEEDNRFLPEPDREKAGDTVLAALTSIIFGSRASAVAIIRNAPVRRPMAHDYGERHGPSSIWTPILRACVRAWASGKRVTHADLMPDNVKITREAKAVSSRIELLAFLETLRELASGSADKNGKKQLRKQFSDYERGEIADGIDLVLELIKPIEDAILNREGLSTLTLSEFLGVWTTHKPSDLQRRTETAVEVLSRTIGFGCLNVLLRYVPDISVAQAQTLTQLISGGRFYARQKMGVLAQLARRPSLHELAGEFAQHVADQIRLDDNIGHRGNSYADLAAVLVPMSVDEAREYYRQGLAQLDQMGGESYDQIYSLLRFAASQKGGLIRPELGQRLMNLCQAIAADEPRKFDWTLFGRAAANSIGFTAMAKLVRWHDQDVVDLSYGLPQLACFLAQNERLDPRRAAFILSICKEHGAWNWHAEDGIGSLIGRSTPSDQRRIFATVFAKLRADHLSNGWPSLWEGLTRVANLYPHAVTDAERDELRLLETDAKRSQDEFNNRNNGSRDFGITRTPNLTSEAVDQFIAALVADCDFVTAGSIDKALATLRSTDGLPFDAYQQLLRALRTACPYPKRLQFLFALCDATKLELRQSLDILEQCMAAWGPSSQHLASNVLPLVDRLFESKSAGLFQSQYSSFERDIRALADFCGDLGHVLGLVLRSIVTEKIELDGDEWLQLAVILCDVATGRASLEALELLLSGPASRIADEIGEGPLRPEQVPVGNEAEIIADITWHLLGNDDAYLRWAVARGLGSLADLGLGGDLKLLLGRFDQREIASLASADLTLSFQNSQEWLLIGLARSALSHGQSMAELLPRLFDLAKRADIHLTNKAYLARCIALTIGPGPCDPRLTALVDEIASPRGGTVVTDLYPPAVAATSGFHFDYEFTQREISTLARLLNIAQGTVEDAIALEIKRLWPAATGMDYFTGQRRYRWERGDRHEFYREHIQRHALLSAATTLSRLLPVAIRSHEAEGYSPWLDWRQRYDTTFDDGSWLSDRKDPLPQQAKENLLGNRMGHQETLQDRSTILAKLGVEGATDGALFPLYARWSSPDGVTVNIVSTLTGEKGAIGRCAAFAKLPSHDLWLPEFWDGGHYDHSYRQENPFDPMVWVPKHPLGIDEGDELAAAGPANRPRLGIDLTATLGLTEGPQGRNWLTTDGAVALSSQAWGGWELNPDDSRHRQHQDGEVLWASPNWLAETLSAHHRQLVFTVTLWKFRSSRDHDNSTGVKSVLVGLRDAKGKIRIWPAKLASKQDH